ncbi:MAG: response regulator transcription factor [Christensenellales bacterium]
MKFLIVEDNIGWSNKLKECVASLGESECAFDGEEGLYMAESNIYDLIIFDMILPKLNGSEFLVKLRQKSVCPAIAVSSLDSKSKIVEGLNLGADDYVVKPFDQEELRARIVAVLRRYNNNFSDIYTCDDIVMDFRNKMLSVGGEYVKLSGKAYEILEFLIRNRNIIISKEQLFNRIWGNDSDTIMTVTEVYISSLRKKLDKFGAKNYIRTVKNIGYMWYDKRDK